MDRAAFLKQEILKIGIKLDDIQIKQFLMYYELLIEWNQVMNLTAITDFEEVVRKHFVDSLSIIMAVEDEYLKSGHKTIIDIGTGAGFPGIPIKIIFPDIAITLLDSLNKRIRFLNEVIQCLKLKDIETVHGRAEDYAKQMKYREKYELCVSRAVANLATLSEYALPFVSKGGYFISYKSDDIDNEIENSQNAVKILGGRIEEVVKFSLPDTDIGRAMIKIKKERLTERKYPRKAGMPSKEPLK